MNAERSAMNREKRRLRFIVHRSSFIIPILQPEACGYATFS